MPKRLLCRSALDLFLILLAATLCSHCGSKKPKATAVEGPSGPGSILSDWDGVGDYPSTDFVLQDIER